MKKTFLLTTAGIAALSYAAQAAVVATDDFSYTDGALVPNGGWASESGTPGTLLVTSGEAVVSQDSGSEDAELKFADNLTTGVITATFDIRVTSDDPMSGTDFEYFAHFSNDTNTNFMARIDIQVPNGTSDFTIGIGDTSSSDAVLPVDFAFGATVPVTLAFSLDTGIGSLTAGGSTVFADAVLGQTLDTFNLRQSNSSSDETIFVDNLSIDYVPEPSVAVLGALGMLGLIRRRR